MKTIKLKAYEFSELNEKAKEKVLQQYCSLNVDNEYWWDFVCEEFNDLGLKINSFDIDRREINIDFIDDISEFCVNVINNSGHEDIINVCEYYLKNKGDKQYYKKLIAEEVLTNLTNEYDYLISEEAVIETIETNEWYFNIDGININNII